jgi:translation initiation factor 2 subunit 1
VLQKKIGMKPKKIRAEFSLTCTSIEGVDLIKEALLTAKHAVNDSEWKVDFKMIAPPKYQGELVTHKRQEGVQKLEEAMDIIQKLMKASKQKFSLKMAPRVIGN